MQKFWISNQERHNFLALLELLQWLQVCLSEGMLHMHLPKKQASTIKFRSKKLTNS